VTVDWVIDADYVDMPEAQIGRREQQARVQGAADAGAVSFHYEHPELPFETSISVRRSAPWELQGKAISSRLTLDRQKSHTVRLRIEAIDHADPLSVEQAAQREQALNARDHDAAYLTSPGESPLVSIVNRAVRDVGSFSLLEGSPDEWLTPGAGVPLYLSLWGRDALTGVWQSSVFDRGEMAAASLARIGRMQGTRVDLEHDEEPGRIIQQARTGPLDRIGKTPFSRYYADQASPFDYIFALAHAFACRGDIELFAATGTRVAASWLGPISMAIAMATALLSTGRPRVAVPGIKAGKTVTMRWCMKTAAKPTRRSPQVKFRLTGTERCRSWLCSQACSETAPMHWPGGVKPRV
jgi:glycogen debranching enzyme